MIRILLFRFWPVLLPLVVYLLWWNLRGKRLRADGLLDAARHRRIVRRTAWASLAIALIVALALLLAIEPREGAYVPAHLENGVLVKGKIVP